MEEYIQEEQIPKVHLKEPPQSVIRLGANACDEHPFRHEQGETPVLEMRAVHIEVKVSEDLQREFPDWGCGCRGVSVADARGVQERHA